MTLGILEQLGIIGAVSVGVMIALWFVQRRTGDAGVVDAGWSFLLGGAGVFCAATGGAPLSVRVIIGVCVGVWGFRLGWHVLTDRVLSGEEDGRYKYLREMAGDKIQPVLFGFYIAQALLVPLLAVPFVVGTFDGADPIGVLPIAGAALWLVGILGESVADGQLKRFKKKSGPKREVCNIGLWRYSRHPNYFCEWLMWVAYALIASGSTHALWAWSAPAIMLLLITKVTGIPPTEARAVRSRGEAYREYQRTTSAFLPWPPNTPPFSRNTIPTPEQSEPSGTSHSSTGG